MGVLFEISIVCHVFVFVVLADGWGFSFLGVVLACPPCFLGFGVLLVSRFFLLPCGLVVGGWGGLVVGGFLGFGVGCARFLLPVGVGVGCARRARLLRFCAGVGCVCAPGSCALRGGWVCLCVWFILGMRFPGVGRTARLFLGGWVCLVSCFVFAVFLVVFAEGFPGVFVSARRFLPLVWGVSGWVGVVFSPAVLPGPGLVRVRVLVLFGEFDPGSGRTLAACLTHASRTMMRCLHR